MFPDPTLKWHPFPSVIDGIKRPPFVFDRGLWRGVLHLIVLELVTDLALTGVEIDCQAYAGFEEMLYSVADHGEGGGYDGGVYIKEAETSRLLEAYREIDPLNREPRHFSFVGGDFCYEVLGFEEPVVRTFVNQDAAYAWAPAYED